jgi:hypothetical protein
MSDTERRRSPRYPVGLPVQVRAGSESGPGQLKSISRLGAMVESEKPHEVGTALHLLIELPDDVVEVRGQVVRADAAGGVHSLGIMFAPLAQADLVRLDSLMPR